jgi:hypothetical protein
MGRPGIVYQDVDSAQAISRLLDEGVDIGGVGHIGAMGVDRRTHLGELSLSARHLVFMACADGNRRPSWSNSRAMAKPRPFEPPVTTALRPVSPSCIYEFPPAFLSSDCRAFMASSNP